MDNKKNKFNDKIKDGEIIYIYTRLFWNKHFTKFFNNQTSNTLFYFKKKFIILYTTKKNCQVYHSFNLFIIHFIFFLVLNKSI